MPIGGGGAVTAAFVPHLLPPRWEWPTRLWNELLAAHKALSALDGTGKHLLNPELILRPLQNREAQKSSSLEGTYTDPRQQVLFAVDPSVPDSAIEQNALREVFNYAEALKLRRGERDALPLSLRLIRRLHAVLMHEVRGSDRNPGEFRRHQNQIGRPARFVPPPANALPELLSNFEKYLHAEDDALDPLVRAFVAHYQFEAIHPFMDGNGRVGRLLLAITIAEGCEMSNEWLYMSDYFDRNKDEYIDRMFEVSASGAWEEWIGFCLRGVVEQARDTMARCERLIDLHREFHEKATRLGGSVRLSAIIDSLFASPVIRVTHARERLGVTYPTARADLARLESAGILTQLENREPITYACLPILDVTFE